MLWSFAWVAAEQIIAFALSLGGQGGVAADHEALAGKVFFGGDFGKIALVKEFGLQLSGVGQLADLTRTQGANPAVAVGVLLPEFVDAGVGEHAAVADEDDAFEPEAFAQGLDLTGDCGGITRGAGEDFDGHRAALTVAKQADVDLALASLLVAVVPELCERAGGAFVVGGGQIVEHGGVLGQVRFGKAAFDFLLPLQQPAHGAVEVVFAHLAQAEFLAQSAGGGGGAEVTGERELGAGQQDMRAAIFAMARARCLPDLRSKRVCSPIPRRTPRTAATWPWGRLRSMLN